MSSGIKEYDIVSSIAGPQWHGKAIVKTREEMLQYVRDQQCFPIIEAPRCFAEIEGEMVPLSELGQKAIFADCRNLSGEGREKTPPRFLALNTPGEDYAVTPNGLFVDTMESAFCSLGIPFQVDSCCNLNNLSVFSLTVELPEEFGKINTPDGHDIAAFLTLVSSHSGLFDWRFQESLFRGICLNTVTALYRSFSSLRFGGKHTKNSVQGITAENLEKALVAMRDGKKEIEEDFEKLANRSASYQEMRHIAAGFFFQDAIQNGAKIPDSVTMTTQSFNATEEIVQLARTGNGNRGQSLYDLFNGGTDYWTNGAGAGSVRVTLDKRLSRSRFGLAAQHKANFGRYLFDSEAVENGAKLGKLALANYESN